jgi:hypothetical protein
MLWWSTKPLSRGCDSNKKACIPQRKERIWVNFLVVSFRGCMLIYNRCSSTSSKAWLGSWHWVARRDAELPGGCVAGHWMLRSSSSLDDCTCKERDRRCGADYLLFFLSGGMGPPLRCFMHVWKTLHSTCTHPPQAKSHPSRRKPEEILLSNAATSPHGRLVFLWPCTIISAEGKLNWEWTSQPCCTNAHDYFLANSLERVEFGRRELHWSWISSFFCVGGVGRLEMRARRT